MPHRSPTALRTTVLGAAIKARRVPLCPEIELFLLSDDVDLRAQVHAILEVETAPFWPFAWAGGQALARYVLDHPETVAGKRVVDLGTGSGIAAIAAAKAGAAFVLGVDLAEEALVATAENATLNGVRVATSVSVPESFDVLLASDVLYEPEIARVIASFEAEGRVLYLGEPGRAAAPKLPHAPLARYACTTHPDVDAPIDSAAVYRIAGASAWATLRGACDR
jgi:predicted nicotinamide N-methyase